MYTLQKTLSATEESESAQLNMYKLLIVIPLTRAKHYEAQVAASNLSTKMI